MGKAAKGIGNVGRSFKKVITNPRKANFGDFASVVGTGISPVHGIAGSIAKEFISPSQEDSTLGGDFSISPEEIARNKALINSEGDRQYNDILGESKTQLGLRQTRRQELADLLSRVSDKQFMRELPNIAENANAGGTYTGTGFSEALAREKGRNAADVQDKLAGQALTDTDAEIALRNSALDKRQGFQTGALSRGFSLEDFIRSANVAKTTGQALQPKTDGKSGLGSIQGAAAGSAAGAPFGPWGAGAGGLLGLLLGGKR